MPKVLTTSLDGDEGPHFEILRAAGFEAVVVPRDIDLSIANNLITQLKGVCAVIAGSESYPRAVIESASELRVISRTGVGFDAIDLAACDDRGVVVATTPGVNHHAVAEHTLALLFGVARGFPGTDRRVREGRWKRIMRPRVMGSTLGIVGFGRIGRAVAMRAVGVGMKVLAYDPFPHHELAETLKVELTGLDDLLERSDYVSLHLPMSAETRRLMNAERFARMKRGSVLINTARGGLVDEPALCAALQSGQLRAAGLDVFEREPLPLDSPLLKLDNLLVAGHTAGLDNESWFDTFTMAAETIVRLSRDDWPAERVQNLKGTSRWRWAKS
jgi:phosphoglycerate dehydrogenase-like enzyme